MKTTEEMLQTWQLSIIVMHISHHVAAARYAKWNRWFGSLASGMSALVASSIFVTVLENQNKNLYIFAAILSLLTAIVTGVVTSLNLSERSKSHYLAATYFQGLLREIEEDLVNCRKAKVKSSYEQIRKRWTEALNVAPPLPQDIHDRVKKNILSEKR